MRTAGIDLATQPGKTGVAVLRWSDSSAVAECVRTGATDDDIVDACLSFDRVGIDVPFGWPEPFAALLEAHRGDSVQPFSYGDTAPSLALRETDRYVRDTFGARPLSVSTDRIGLTAIRAAAIQARLRQTGRSVLRDGSGHVVEVYPATALKWWGLSAGSYKGAHKKSLPDLVDKLMEAAPWLDLGEFTDSCRVDDDAFDAVVSALVARAHALGRWRLPPAGAAGRTAVEGWIVVPDCALSDLVSAVGGSDE